MILIFPILPLLGYYFLCGHTVYACPLHNNLYHIFGVIRDFQILKLPPQIVQLQVCCWWSMTQRPPVFGWRTLTYLLYYPYFMVMETYSHSGVWLENRMSTSIQLQKSAAESRSFTKSWTFIMLYCFSK